MCNTQICFLECQIIRHKDRTKARYAFAIYLRNNQPADDIVLEQNKICLELAEAALQKIDWNKYKKSQAKRLVFIFNMTFKIFLYPSAIY